MGDGAGHEEYAGLAQMTWNFLKDYARSGVSEKLAAIAGETGDNGTPENNGDCRQCPECAKSENSLRKKKCSPKCRGNNAAAAPDMADMCRWQQCQGCSGCTQAV